MNKSASGLYHIKQFKRVHTLQQFFRKQGTEKWQSWNLHYRTRAYGEDRDVPKRIGYGGGMVWEIESIRSYIKL